MSYGIRVKNPLPLPVKVQVWEGKKIIRDVTIDPSRTKFIELDKPGDYDVRSMIVDNVYTGSYDELGPGELEIIDHQEVAPPEKTAVFRHNVMTLNRGYWKSVVRWDIPKGGEGELLAVEIEQYEGVEWRLKMGHWLDARDNHCKASTLIKSTTFEQCNLRGGEAVIVQARAKGMKGITVSARISGRQLMTEEDLSTVRTKPMDEEPDDTPVRSMADMFRDMEKEEVKV